MKNIAIVADWLVSYAGAERVIVKMLESYPESDLFSIVDFLSDSNRKYFKGKLANTSFIQKLPFASKKYQNYLPLMPLAIEQLDVTKYDIIISSSHAVAKGIITGPDQLHISYVHSPIRYAWDLQHQYLRESGLEKGLKSILIRYILHKIRMWDVRTANGVDYFLANSNFISRRIEKVYGRKSDVIYPPVNVEQFKLLEDKEDYYLTASRLVPYKRVDLIVQAFNAMPDKKLIVIGKGSELEKIKRMAKSNVQVMGFQEDSVLKEHMQKCKAFIFAAEEDFGITPVEAMACGTPVIAFGKGGSLETVVSIENNNPTGIFFYEQDVKQVIEAVLAFESSKTKISPYACRERAEKFSEFRFEKEFENYIEKKWDEFKGKIKTTNCKV